MSYYNYGIYKMSKSLLDNLKNMNNNINENFIYMGNIIINYLSNTFNKTAEDFAPPLPSEPNKQEFGGSTVTSFKHYNFVGVSADLKNYIPNPHLDNHNCFSENRTAIVTQLTNGDAIGAIECAIACAASIIIYPPVL